MAILDGALRGLAAGADRPGRGPGGARTERGGEGPRVLLLEGEHGLGKSRLVRELRYRAQLQGLVTCEGSGVGGRSFGAVARVLEEVAASLVPGADPLVRHGAELARLVPSLGGAPGAPASGLEDSRAARARLREALAEFLVEASRENPLVLILEDLHEADEGTLELVGDLACRLREAEPGDPARLLVCASARPGEAMRTLAAGGGMAPGAVVHRVLAPLGPADVEALVLSMLPMEDGRAVPGAAGLVGWVTREALGHPLDVEELMRAALDAGCLVQDEEGLRVDEDRLRRLRIPSSLDRLVEGRLAALGRGARGLLRSLAILGGAADPASATRIGAQTPAGAAGAFRELERVRLVQAGTEGRWSIAHGRVREAVLRHTPRRVLRRLHRAAFEALVERRGRREATSADADVEDLAHHALGAWPGVEAVDYAAAAAERCRRLYCNDRALELADEALARLGARRDPSRRAGLHAVRAAVGRHTGALDSARSACLAWEEAAREAGDRPMEGRARLALGGVEAEASRFDGALACLEEARLRLAACGDAHGEAEALAARGRVLKDLGRYPEALAALGEALGRLRREGRPSDVATCLGNIGLVLQETASDAEALERFQEARLLYEGSGDRRGVASCLNSIAGILGVLGRDEEAQASYRTALATFEEVGYRRAVGVVHENLARHHHRHGRLDEAAGHCARSLRIRRRVGDRLGEAKVATIQAVVDQDLGELASAMARHQAALGLYRELGDRRGEVSCQVNMGEIHCDRAEYGLAVDRHAEALDLCAEGGYRLAASHALLGLARARTGAGAFEEAARDLERVRSESGGGANPGLGSVLEGLRAALHLARGEAALAVETARRAMEGGSGAERSAGLALALPLAEALVDQGACRDAGEAVSRVEELAEVLGTRPVRQAALYLRGRWALVVGNLVEARASLREALELASGVGLPDRLWRAHHAMALLEERRGSPAEAGVHYRGAMEVVRGVWRGLPAHLRDPYLRAPARARLRADALRFVGPGAGAAQDVSPLVDRPMGPW